jgi:hypothetical protein
MDTLWRFTPAPVCSTLGSVVAVVRDSSERRLVAVYSTFQIETPLLSFKMSVFASFWPSEVLLCREKCKKKIISKLIQDLNGLIYNSVFG